MWDQRYYETAGWAKYNKHYWLEGGFDDFRAFFFSQMYSEPLSTKQIENCLRWSSEIAPQTLVDTTAAPGLRRRDLRGHRSLVCGSAVPCASSARH